MPVRKKRASKSGATVRVLSYKQNDETGASQLKIAVEEESPEAKRGPKPHPHDSLRRAVRFFYDLQKLRVQCGNREASRSPVCEPALTPDSTDFLGLMSGELDRLEKTALKEIRQLLRPIPVYNEWLVKQKGCGPTMSGLILSEFRIEMCSTPSQMWAWAGLAVVDGRADRLVRGQRARFNPWLKSKMLGVLGECLIKSNSPWRSFYDNYKHRKQNERVEICAGCKGKGRYEKSAQLCKNCGGTGGPAPWGASDKHRHMASIRYMVKMFLAELWNYWRDVEGLPTRVPYAEEYLNRPHLSSHH